MTKKSNRLQILLTLDEESDQFVKEFVQWKAKKESRSVASFVKFLIKKEMGSVIVSAEDDKIHFKVIA